MGNESSKGAQRGTPDRRGYAEIPDDATNEPSPGTAGAVQQGTPLVAVDGPVPWFKLTPEQRDAMLSQKKAQFNAFMTAYPPDAVYEVARYEVRPEQFSTFASGLVNFYAGRDGCKLLTVLSEVGNTHVKALVQYESYYHYDQAKLAQEGDPEYSTVRSAIRSATSNLLVQSLGRFEDLVTGPQSEAFPARITTDINEDACTYVWVKNPMVNYISFNTFGFFGKDTKNFHKFELCGVFTLITSETGTFYELWKVKSAGDAHEAMLRCAGLRADGTTSRLALTTQSKPMLKEVELCRAIPASMLNQWASVSKQQDQK